MKPNMTKELMSMNIKKKMSNLLTRIKLSLIRLLDLIRLTQIICFSIQ